MRKRKILHVINGMGSGGAEADIMNWFRLMVKQGYQFDFLIRSDQLFYEDEIKSLGGVIYRVPEYPRKFLANIFETWHFLKENNDYDAIHIHGNTLFYIYPLIMAKMLCINNKILHIHNNKANGRISGIVHNLHRLFFLEMADYRLACSKSSGHFGYGKKDFMVINNGIDVKKILKSVPKKLDSLYKLTEDESNPTVFIHIGRFLPVKNQTFVLDVFNAYQKKDPNSILLLIGIGPDLQKIKDKAETLHLSNKIMFLEETTEVSNYLKAADILVFPSLYEGVPLVVLEAQAAGLKSVIADTITEDVVLTPYVRYCSLSDSPEVWAKSIEDFMAIPVACDIEKCFKENYYDLNSSVNRLLKIYGDRTE